MDELTLAQIHELCLQATQEAIHGFGWVNIDVGALNEEEMRLLEMGSINSVLNWRWAMERYSGEAADGLLHISIKLIGHQAANTLHAAIICKYDFRRSQFALCMLENFLEGNVTQMTGKVLIIALVYATTFCKAIGIDEIYIQNPTPGSRQRYVTYGFAQVWDDADKMSASVNNILLHIKAKVAAIELGNSSDRS
ncbi:hypothetical protein Q3V30_14540 [Erwinia pyri]|uniref:Uncharacterized protein n=1 Tax=Erwinia pyri TaxID=3062598 RepID=A0AA50HP61_9GAMM|nr:hypothetical protein [Erwinia sp. DE2]WLS77690.1 hypothetical protein Q3V30_14540 [Erwinia sp. DE2]